jgi:hypothetical protein
MKRPIRATIARIKALIAARRRESKSLRLADLIWWQAAKEFAWFALAASGAP